MEIRLWDMDIPYELTIDCNDDGKDFVRIKSQPDENDRDENYDICIDSGQCIELAQVLMFLAKQIKTKVK